MMAHTLEGLWGFGTQPDVIIVSLVALCFDGSTVTCGPSLLFGPLAIDRVLPINILHGVPSYGYAKERGISSVPTYQRRPAGS